MSDFPDAVHRHEAALIKLAIQWALEHPEVRGVAWVGEQDAPETPRLRAVPGSVRGEDGSVALMMDRESAKRILAVSAPQALDWLADGDTAAGPVHTLPIVHSARHGTRTVSLTYELPFLAGGGE